MTRMMCWERRFDTDALDQTSRDFLDSAIKDYNAAFNTNFDTSADKFQNYYKDLFMRVKNREVDLLIVVNMFLTGFDATTLNTLWVDKNLKMHGLIQAYSWTNRILNSVKTYGNIVCFRDLQQATDDAIALFGDKNANGIVLLRSFADYYNGYEDDNGRHHPGYVDLIAKLESEFSLGAEIVGDQAEKNFIRLLAVFCLCGISCLRLISLKKCRLLPHGTCRIIKASISTYMTNTAGKIAAAKRISMMISSLKLS